MIDKIKLLSKNLTFEEINENVDKQFFCDVINKLNVVYNANIKLLTEIGIDLTYYNELLYSIIDQLLEDKYGQFKTDIIFWYINFGLEEDDDMFPLKIFTKDKVETHKIKTPEELYNILSILPNNGKILYFEEGEEDDENDEQ